MRSNPYEVDTKRTGSGTSTPTRPDLWNRAIDAWYRATGKDGEFRCPQCGYELRGLPAPGGFFQCPECGTATERYKAVVPREPITWWQRWRQPVLIAAASLAVILALCLHPLFLLGVAAPFVGLVPWAGGGGGGRGAFGYRRWAYDLDAADPVRKERPSRSPPAASAAADHALSTALDSSPGRAADSKEQAADTQTTD